MKRIAIVLVATLAASTPLWATIPNQVYQIGLCNSCISLGGCIPGPCPMPCPSPCSNPCPQYGGCQVSSCMVAVSNCLMTGPCGGCVGMQTQCAMTSHIGGTPHPCMPTVLMQSLVSLGVDRTMLLTLGLP